MGGEKGWVRRAMPGYVDATNRGVGLGLSGASEGAVTLAQTICTPAVDILATSFSCTFSKVPVPKHAQSAQQYHFVKEQLTSREQYPVAGGPAAIFSSQASVL